MLHTKCVARWKYQHLPIEFHPKLKLRFYQRLMSNMLFTLIRKHMLGAVQVQAKPHQHPAVKLEEIEEEEVRLPGTSISNTIKCWVLRWMGG